MISADALIHAVQLRMQVARRWLRQPGELPAGWQQWFDAMGERAGAVTGASAEALVAVLLQRPLAVAPGRVSDLTRWQALSTLWRQEWHAHESRDERRWHWLAAGISGGWHLLLGALLAWLMYLELISAAHPPPKGEELVVVQVEYVGDGAPEDVGGGPAPEPTEPVDTVEPAASIEPAEVIAPPEALPPAETMVATPTPAPQIIEREALRTMPAEATQPLIVSEPVPDRSEVFVLPPTTPRIEAPAIEIPELSAPTTTVEVVEIPQPPAPAPRASVQPIAQARIEQPVLQPAPATVVVRDLPAPEAPVPRAVVPVLQPDRPAPPVLEATAPQARVRDIPSPPVATAGPEETPAPGGWPSPERADDWGAAAREQPGGQKGEPPGLYDSDGSVRLAQTPGSASPGQAPGTITAEIADLDRAGTWLRRPPNDYEPTAFAEYWRPNESLLEEWVRKSITTIRIPIPGTNKYIECTTVMLVMGGGCGIGDPNLNEQPATARPPPDIPFKPELQEGNGSVPPPAG